MTDKEHSKADFIALCEDAGVKKVCLNIIMDECAQHDRCTFDCAFYDKDGCYFSKVPEYWNCEKLFSICDDITEREVKP